MFLSSDNLSSSRRLRERAHTHTHTSLVHVISQVYNESIKDLFVEPGRPAAAANKHDIRLDKKGRVYVEGLVECEVRPEWPERCFKRSFPGLYNLFQSFFPSAFATLLCERFIRLRSAVPRLLVSAKPIHRVRSHHKYSADKL